MYHLSTNKFMNSRKKYKIYTEINYNNKPFIPILFILYFLFKIKFLN